MSIRQKKSFWKMIRKDFTWYLFLAPCFVMFAVFLIYPIGQSLYLSFTDSNGVIANWVGLRSYGYTLRYKVFLNALYNTFYLTGLIVTVQTSLALIIADQLNRCVFARTTLRLLYILPYLTTIAAGVAVWVYLYDPSRGPFNWILQLIGFRGIGWLNDPSTSKISVVLFSIWRNLGYCIVIYLAGLQAIPKGVYEAASIDGAGPRQTFFRITVPLVKPTTVFIVIVSVIGNLRQFQVVYIFGSTTGSPARSIQTVVAYIYEQGFFTEMWGLACAAAWILFAIVFVVTMINTKVLMREEKG